MATFVDGAGVPHVFKLRHRHLAAIEDKFGLDVEAAFKAAYLPGADKTTDERPLVDLLYGDARRLAGVVVEVCDLPADRAKAALDGMDAEALDRGRDCLMEMLGNFSLPPAVRTAVLAAYRKHATTAADPSGGGSKGSASAG